MKKLKALLVLVIVACMLWVGPVHPIREVGYDHTGNDGHEITRPLEVNESITQYFRATDNNIIQLEFAVDFDERYVKEGQLKLELMDSLGNIVFAETLDYGAMPDYKYSGPLINIRLKKGREYSYRLTNLNITENKPCIVYTSDEEACSLKKGRMEFDGTVIEGEILTKITSNKPLTTENRLALCGCIGLIGFSIYELLNRIEKNGEGKEHEMGEISFKNSH